MLSIHFLTDIECPLSVIQGEKDEYFAQLQKTVDQGSGYAEEFIYFRAQTLLSRKEIFKILQKKVTVRRITEIDHLFS